MKTLQRLVLLNWKMLATKIWCDFQSEFYRQEIEAIHVVIDGVFHEPADQAENYYVEGRKFVDRLAEVIGKNHPEVIALTGRLTQARAMVRVRQKRQRDDEH